MTALRASLRRRPVAAIVIAVLTTLGVLEARQLGLLLPPELQLHDALLRLRGAGSRAPQRVVLIRIREEDVARLGHPLPDAVLADVLQRILAAKPRAVGIDLYRDLPADTEDERLPALFARDDRLVAIEKFPDRDRPGTPAPPWLRGSDQVGFSDVLLDEDGVVRRALLFLWDDQDRIHVSLGLRLALRYLAFDGIALESREPRGEALQLGRAELRPFLRGDAAYAAVDDRGYQLLLDHQRSGQAFDAFPVAELLGGRIPPAALEDRVVILGTTAPSVKDVFYTPFSSPAAGSGGTSGMDVHAQVVDQLLRRALDGEPPVRSPGSSEQAAAIALLCLAGAALGVAAPSVRLVWVGGSAVALGLLGGAFAALRAGFWLPVLPPLLGFVASTAFAVAHVLREERREKAVLRELFSRHVSKRVLDELWRKRAQFMEEGRLRTQRMTLTVLMADLQGYTEASEKMEPAALLDWVNAFMSRMAQLVETSGGVVDDYWGDGLKANFSIPVPRTTEAEIEEDARAAVSCARQMAREMARLNAGWQAGGLPTARLRVGIHTGPVVVGSIGSRERLKYTSVGDTVNLAARLEHVDREAFAAEAGTEARILVSDETKRRLAPDMAAEPLGTRRIPGREQPVTVWRIPIGAQPAATAKGRSA